MARRGELTHAVLNVAKNRLGYEITQRELRLMPYVCYVLVNHQEIDRRKTNKEERQYIQKWVKKGWLYYDEDGYLQSTKDFFIQMQELIYLGFVVYRNYTFLADTAVNKEKDDD